MGHHGASNLLLLASGGAGCKCWFTNVHINSCQALVSLAKPAVHENSCAIQLNDLILLWGGRGGVVQPFQTFGFALSTFHTVVALLNKAVAQTGWMHLLKDITGCNPLPHLHYFREVGCKGHHYSVLWTLPPPAAGTRYGVTVILVFHPVSDMVLSLAQLQPSCPVGFGLEGLFPDFHVMFCAEVCLAQPVYIQSITRNWYRKALYFTYV